MTEPFERIYMEEQSPKSNRDRIQIELSNSKREILTRHDLMDMQLALHENQEAATIKFWAKYGWLKYSHHDGANTLLRDQVFKNGINKFKSGVNVEREIKDKFHQIQMKNGGNF